MLASVYENYRWIPWKFNSVPDGYWDDQENRRWYLKWLGKKLGIKHWSDWHHVKMEV